MQPLSDTSEVSLDDLPEEIRAVIELQRLNKMARIEALSKTVASLRDKAVKAREASGIEQEWVEDIEHYEGIDDANRKEHRSIKPNHPTGVLTTERKNSTRSTVFVNITQPYVDSAAASVSEMGNPTDDRNFSIKPTPIPDLGEHKDNQSQVVMNGQPLSVDGKPLTVADLVEEQIEIARKKAEAAQRRIDDWLVECQWHSEMRKVVFDAAQIGSGIMKGCYPVSRKLRKTEKDPKTNQLAFVIKEEIVPASKRISAFDFFPDPNCGENIHNGSYVVERDYLSAKQLKDLKGVPGYIAEQIDKVLKEGAGKRYSQSPESYQMQNDDDRFEVWYYYGTLEREDLEAMGVEDEKIAAMESVPAVVTLINDTAIRAYLNPLDSGEFPYDIVVWKRRTNSPFGMGVSRIMRTAQRMVVAGTRNLMDNAGLSGGVQIGFKKGSITPFDGSWNLTPIKIWQLNDSETRSIQDCLSFTQIPSLQAELMNIINFGMKLAEDVTGLPMLMQGQQGAAPDTVGGMQLLNKNSSVTRRMIARQIDDDLTEPHIRRYYEWIMLYGEESEKGDFTIDARGSSALVERDIQNQFAIQMLANSLNPAFGLDPEKAMEEALKAGMLDPKKFKLDEDKKKQAQQQQPAPPPQVQVAQIRAQADAQIAQLRMQTEERTTAAKLDHDEHIAKMQDDRDVAYNQSLTNRDQMTYQARMAEMQLRERLAMLDYANKNQITLDKIKAELSGTVMKLRVQKELASQDAHAEPVITPPVEIPGRAQPGHAYEQ